jgi:hypothetical protein
MAVNSAQGLGFGVTGTSQQQRRDRDRIVVTVKHAAALSQIVAAARSAQQGRRVTGAGVARVTSAPADPQTA